VLVGRLFCKLEDFGLVRRILLMMLLLNQVEPPRIAHQKPKDMLEEGFKEKLKL
jgi:hypothetical protein